ncbi:hypothetical protein [Salmonella enterica]|uniref:hypothetical protein n=1 Tax=Salmonella enterica TaxID=28901 RepID=UPI001EFEC93F|nr:hypothetical protein [Salmonella enterica]
MKNTTPDVAVLQELKELTSRIFKICEQNNMPVVIGYSYELSRNEDGYSINKSITAYADEKTGGMGLHYSRSSHVAQSERRPPGGYWCIEEPVCCQ